MARKASKTSRWAVTVRLANGSIRYYARRSLRHGQQEWTPRENQAHRFSTMEDAAAFAASCVLNGDAVEYAVESVPA